MTAPIRILLVDDQELIRVGFRLVLEAEPDFEVVGEAEDGDAAIRAARERLPDIVLMDVRMPRRDGVDATAELVRTVPDARVIVLTTFDLDEYAFGALDAGASGFLLKDVRREELIGAIRAVHRGDAVLSPRITRALIARVGAPAPAADPQALLAPLTEREREVFLALAGGLTNAEIAASLHLGESTVKTHVGRILAKLGARDRVHAVILAHRSGLVDSGR